MDIFNHMVKYEKPSLNGVFGALAAPTRRRIVELLASGPVTVTEVASHFRISLPAVSKHLRVLEQAGIIRRQKRGREHRLGLRGRPMEDASRWLDQYRRFWEESFDAFSEYLATNHNTKEEE